jgi:hypothetical protein
MQPYVHPKFGPLHLGRPTVSPRNRKTLAKALLLHEFMMGLPSPPVFLDNSSGIKDWGMMLNDSEGDCTCATAGHMIQAWTALSGKEVTVPDSAIQLAYEQACGYVPGYPSTDQGGVITNVLDYFKNVGIGGHKIYAHAEVNITQLRVQQALQCFGVVDFGLSLPLSAQNQVGSVWDIVGDGKNGPSAPGSWGGHSTPVVKYDHIGGVWVVTWGMLQQISWRFLMYYSDEAQACISPDFTKAPAGLVADLQQIGS